MAEVRPFKALFYNEKKVGALKNVVVPPYDVISPREKKAFLKKSRFNYVRIILGKKNDHYASVAKIFRQWVRQGVLVEDAEPHFYFWEQIFKREKRIYRRRGIVAAVSLDDYKQGQILPHEKTLSATKRDRLKILKACQANLSPIFMIYRDPTRALERKIVKRLRRPFLRVKDTEGVVSKLFRIDRDLEMAIREGLFAKKFYIVDGHHRFETAFRYCEAMKRKKKENHNVHYVLSTIVNMDDPALKIYPIFRILKGKIRFDKEKYLALLKSIFIIRKKKGMGRLKRRRWGIWFRKDPYFYELMLRNKKMGLRHELDVTLLHRMIIPKHLHPKLLYMRGMGERLKDALTSLHRGTYQVMWGTSAPTLQELRKVADARKSMPPKSTFFYPKLLSGAIIRRF